jgi:glycogen operon protein
VRRFLRGDPGLIGTLASRISGSSDLFGGNGALPTSSINFVTCHDGFTLADLVSYSTKHNENNGESNRDGADNNFSSNWGVEGPTDDPEVLAIRRRQAKNHVLLLMLSQGVPMLLAGDEMLRSQLGNNNAWCQDNEISWLDWSLTDTNADMVRFTAAAISLRKRHPAMRRQRYMSGRQPEDSAGIPDIAWHGASLAEPDWDDLEGLELAFTLGPAADDEPPVHVALNMTDVANERRLPRLRGMQWRCVADTALGPPLDIVEPADAVPVAGDSYAVQPFSIAVFEAYPA